MKAKDHNQKDNKTIEYPIRISNSLIQSQYPILPTVDSHRILQLGLSGVCKNLHNNKNNKEALEAALTVSLKTKTLKDLFPSFNRAGNIHKRIDNATSIILQNNFIKTKKDHGNFKKTAFIDNIEYKDFHEIIITFMESTRECFNPESQFTRYVINNTVKLSTYQQIRIYELCYQYILSKQKYRTIDIPTFKQFVGIGKNKKVSDVIRELKACIDQINQKTNLEIEFNTIKTSRKITHIKFSFCRKDIHPLELINQEKQERQERKISIAINQNKQISNTNNTSNIKAQLIELGFKTAKLPSLLKIPAEVLTQAITATNKAKTKGFKKTMEACFFFQVGIIKSNDENPTKIEPVQLVGMFKDNLSIEAMKDLWDEFYAQLSQEQKAAYSGTNREQNKTTKQALERDFTTKFNRWIYEVKIRQQ